MECGASAPPLRPILHLHSTHHGTIVIPTEVSRRLFPRVRFRANASAHAVEGPWLDFNHETTQMNEMLFTPLDKIPNSATLGKV